MFFCVFRGTMARTDWLGDTGTGFGKAVLGIALNFGVFFASCPGWQGWTGEDGGAQRMGRIRREKGTERWDGEDRLAKNEEKTFYLKR